MELRNALLEQTKTIEVALGRESLRITYRPYAITYEERLRYDRRAADLQDRIDEVAARLADARRRRSEALAEQDAERADRARAEMDALQQQADALVDETFRMYADALCAVIADWDMREDGAPLPIDGTTFRRLPQNALSQILEAIQADQGERSAGRSLRGSRARAS